MLTWLLVLWIGNETWKVIKKLYIIGKNASFIVIGLGENLTTEPYFEIFSQIIFLTL